MFRLLPSPRQAARASQTPSPLHFVSVLAERLRPLHRRISRQQPPSPRHSFPDKRFRTSSACHGIGATCPRQSSPSSPFHIHLQSHRRRCQGPVQQLTLPNFIRVVFSFPPTPSESNLRNDFIRFKTISRSESFWESQKKVRRANVAPTSGPFDVRVAPSQQAVRD